MGLEELQGLVWDARVALEKAELACHNAGYREVASIIYDARLRAGDARDALIRGVTTSGRPPT